MTKYPVHTLDTAPAASRSSLEALRDAFGFVPNMAGAMATSPVLIGGLVGLFGQVHGGSFTESEIQVLLLTNAVANEAAWAVAFHSYLAVAHCISETDVAAIRGGRSPQAPRPAALSNLARALIANRGHLCEADEQAFLAAGFGPDHLLEVIAVVAASTMTNYTSSVTRPPLDEAIVRWVWNGSA